jgi:hypothetical protein
MSASAFALTPLDGPRRSPVELDLWSVAAAAGLNPKGRGRNFAFDCPECGRKGKASGRTDGPWHCFVCDAKGNALTLARRFELAGTELPPSAIPAPATTNRNGVAPSTVRAAWGALEIRRDAHREDLARWLAEARRWPADLAEAGARVSGVAWIPADCPELPPSLAWVGRDADRRAAFALRDARGEVWTLERRWTAAAPPPDENTPKAKRLPTRAEEREELAVFGRIPDAVAAARRGEPVYLCEGGPDYLAAAALCRLDGHGAALGAHGHHGLPKVAAALRAALEGAAVPSRDRPRPVRAAPGRQGRRGRAVDARRRRRSRRVLRRARRAGAGGPGDGKGDLADAAPGGADALRGILDTAVPLYAAPVDLADPVTATEQIRAAMLRALQAADGPNALALVIMPPGVGKTTAAFERAAYAARQGRRVVFALPDHENAGRSSPSSTQPSPTCPPSTRRGWPRCASCPPASGQARRHRTRRRARWAAACARAARWPVARTGEPARAGARLKARVGVVTFAAHAGIASLASGRRCARPIWSSSMSCPPWWTCARSARRTCKACAPGASPLAAGTRPTLDTGPSPPSWPPSPRAIDAETPRGVYAARVEIARVVDALRERPAALDAAAEPCSPKPPRT